MTSHNIWTPDFSLTGRRALVTGGASGIGQAIALALAHSGADVAVTSHSRPADETVAEVEKAGRKSHDVQIDLGAIDAPRAADLIAGIERDFGHIDILVNNAGIIRRGPALEHKEGDWRDVIATNMDAVWYLCQAVGHGMVQRGYGRIVNIASLLSFQGGLTVPGYTASKHAVAGITKALSNEWASKGISINAIAPGYIVTANTKDLRADEVRYRQISERIPAGRWGEAKDIAGTAVFLSSPAADYINGHVLVVDGGWMGR